MSTKRRSESSKNDFNVNVNLEKGKKIMVKKEIKTVDCLGELETDMNDFINDYLCGVFDNSIQADEDGNIEEEDIFALYCKVGKCFDIFCDKLNTEKNNNQFIGDLKK
jgi:hypothetical protein